ncbi:MAG: hypothetical protein DMF79_02475 [Acidobacteria bacterium]|nr:MAG: hypothetical protein DMF79_02475 [Acidobacteriota bacterium]
MPGGGAAEGHPPNRQREPLGPPAHRRRPAGGDRPCAGEYRARPPTTQPGSNRAGIAVLFELRARGVGIQIDDFGTGYSSLSYLQKLPVDTLKIDRSFVSRLDEAGEKAEIVESIIALARSLDLDVIAEGIETERQLARLRMLRCDGGQGFLLSKPMPAEDLRAFLPGVRLWTPSRTVAS